MSTRRAKQPLNAGAVTAANEALWTAHPELKGRQLTMGPEDAALRKEWMDAYIAAGGQVEGGDPPKPPEDPVTPCPLAPKPVTSLVSPTPSLADLPQSVSISEEACKSMQEMWGKSFDADGNSTEVAGTLALDPDGNLVVLNQTGGTPDDSTPSTDVPDGYTYIGTVHTHPYGKKDGDWDGVNVPFSDGDFSTLDDYNESVSMVQSGDNKYVLVKTKESIQPTDAEAEKAYKDVFDPEYQAQIDAGKTPAEAANIAGEKATAAVAEKYKWGYYKGTDCQNLARVNPP